MPTRRYAATGPSKLGSGENADYVEAVVRNLSPTPSEITTGAAEGVDTVFCMAALTHWPGAHHRVVIPYAPHNSELIELLMTRHPQVELVLMPPVWAGTDRELRRKAYRARNERMLSFSDCLVSFVWRPTWYRSGEWMTNRIAEDAGIAIEQHILQ